MSFDYFQEQSQDIAGPLSWEESRLRMRNILEHYMKFSSSTMDIKESWWFINDFDIVFGSVLFSLVYMVVSILSFYQRKPILDDTQGSINQKAVLHASKLQILASCFFLVTSLLSAWVIRRQKQKRLCGGHIKKRNIISSFLKILCELDSTKVNDGKIKGKAEDNIIKLKGTPLTDIYSVYRKANKGKGEWHRIPSLLLVKGDFVALQVGDRVPADCALIIDNNICSLAPLTRAGSKIMMHQEIGFENNQINSCSPDFPPGQSSFSENSTKLLKLSRDIRVFVLQESPIEKFLQKEEVQHNSPQIHRQVNAIRKTLYVFHLVLFFFLMPFILLVRFNMDDTDFLILLQLPLMAGISMLPTVTPCIIFLLEIIGTTQILVVSHPYVSSTSRCHSQTHLLFLKYFSKTFVSRLFSDSDVFFGSNFLSNLIGIPPASSCIFERLGVTTALALADDELVCDPYSTPQQLLIPSVHGLKLLDLYPKYDNDNNEKGSPDEERIASRGRRHAKSFGSSNYSSDSDDYQSDQHFSPRKKSQHSRKFTINSNSTLSQKHEPKAYENFEVQFEDPHWWQYLPSLKCIGLGCLLVDNQESNDARIKTDHVEDDSLQSISNKRSLLHSTTCNSIQNSLIQHVCQFQNRSQNFLLSKCIGFTTQPNMFGKRGDLSPFSEKRRFHVLATRLLNNRISLDRHAIGLEESRNHGVLRPDATSVLVEDMRSKAYQLLTVGDATVVTELCSDCWQGSTITPLNSSDRHLILESSNNWNLSDLNVTAFSYCPIPYTLEERFGGNSLKSYDNRTYLVDNRQNTDVPLTSKMKGDFDDWSLVRNQIFLGLLGSCVNPIKEIEPLIEDCSNAGIRFVYFSPRNMRRTKELASQMGIDVGWNCAISLRPLDEGEEADAHRMPSNYADWDVNARLPHGIENVKKHLAEVDNVPLLVSLYTDATKHNTAEMISVFQNYSDTVLSIGLSHMSCNDETFSVADLSIGVDLLIQDITVQDQKYSIEGLTPDEIFFVCSITAHSCLFNLPASSALIHISDIVAGGRSALENGISAGLFMVTGYVSFTLFIFLSICSISTGMPFVSSMGSVFVLLFVIPGIGLTMSFTDSGADLLEQVPIKNDEMITFGVDVKKRLYIHTFLRALIPAAAPNLLYLISLGSLMYNEPQFLIEHCGMSNQLLKQEDWKNVIRCNTLNEYSGPAKISSGCLMIAELTMCLIFLSASFISRRKPLFYFRFVQSNLIWLFSIFFCTLMVILYLSFSLEDDTLSRLPWYYFLLAFSFPCATVFISEILKKNDTRHEIRAEGLRRLQFETRLGMWSPK